MQAGKRSRTRTARFTALAVVAALAITGCGPQSEPTPTATSTPTAAAPSPTATPTPTPTAPADPLPEGAVTALLLGTDSRTPGSMTGQADAIMLAQISADRETLSLVSITRDSWVSIPGYGAGKINSAFARGGTSVMVDTISAMYGGLEIDYVVQADFEGFIAMTRALDGFDAANQHPTQVTVNSTGRVLDFTADSVHLSGTDGLIYVRQRKGLPQGDLDRAERQRAAVAGMLERIDEIATENPAELVNVFGHFAERLKITGELSIDDMIALASLSQNLERDDVVSLMSPITGFGNQGGQSVNVVDEAQTAALGEALRAGDIHPYVEQHGTGY
ncbi:LCP family protein [Agrococcus sp. ARC_14]|uniref:LCP family protein n=1 Tax=Agrococcus sp. ARC_14 TaxID=2919927 RepID=UPI001F05472F|nr:LCP family protein [Agrococcus sp. ARC_14]MCH1883683.1 LCP family protein [Agrococcus sp. ARC_14]